MTTIAARGPFVRLPVASGRFQPGGAAAFAGALDAASQEPTTRAALVEVALPSSRMEGRLGARTDTVGDRLFLRLGGLMLALTGALSAAPRLTRP